MHSMLSRSVLPCALLLLSLSASAQEAKVEAAVAAETNASAAVEADASAAAATEVATPAAAAAEATVPAPATEATTEAAPAPAATTGLVGTPPEGKGQIVFFRPSKFVGGAIGFKVREGTTELGKLRSGKYFIAAVEPGTHEYTVHSETKDVLTLEVEAGETYYVQGTITMGVLAGRPNLSPSDATTFNGMSAKLKLAN